jgi:FKBP-type peptidyl-prolyl cis-trans isomerase FklB
MKRKHIVLLGASLLVLSANAMDQGDKKKKPKDKDKKSTVVLANESDSLSYAIGISIANNIATSGIEGLNESIMGQAVLDHANKSNQLPNEMVDPYIQGILARRESEKASKTMEKETTFLKENGQKQGVVTTESGLQYKVIREGIGLSPDDNDTIVVNYKGTLVDGTVFDSSYERNEPITITAGQVIQGWGEGLKLMKSGGKYELFIPQNLAYGEQGAGGVIPPFATLIFEMEIVEIKPAN